MPISQLLESRNSLISTDRSSVVSLVSLSRQSHNSVVSCGFVAVSLLQQSAALATASSQIAWVAHLENGSYELTHCHTLLNDTKGDRCTSISHVMEIRKSQCTEDSFSTKRARMAASGQWLMEPADVPSENRMFS